MSNKMVISTLGAIVALGFSAQCMAADPGNTTMQNTTAEKLKTEMPTGFEKCYGIAKSGKNDCASGTQACAGQSKVDNAKDAWVGLPKGTCDRILGGSTSPGSTG